MSASNRKLTRLPLTIFEGLIDPERRLLQRQCDDQNNNDHRRDENNNNNIVESSSSTEEEEKLRSKICFRLKRFPVPKQYGTRRSTNISTVISIKTVGDLLRTPKRTLLHALDPIFTYEELCLFLKRTHQECAAKPISALELLHSTLDDDTLLHNRQQQQRQSLQQQQQGQYNNNHETTNHKENLVLNKLRNIPTGIPALDVALGGGIRVGTITEVVGPAGIGKTQLAFQLLIHAARYKQGAMYIDTENKLNLQRLKEMCWQQRYEHSISLQQQQQQRINNNNYMMQIMNNNNNNDTNSTQRLVSFPFRSPEEVLDNLSVHTPSSTVELLQFLDSAEDIILNQPNNATSTTTRGDGDGDCGYPVRLLIVDSIAAPMKRDFGSDSAPQRAAAIFKCAQTLKRLADQLPVAVIAINQVALLSTTTSSSNVGSDTINNNSNNNNNLRASLGTSWRHCVSTSLFLSRDYNNNNNKNNSIDQQQQRQQLGNYGDHVVGMMNGDKKQEDIRQVHIVKSIRAPLLTVDYKVEQVGLVEVVPIYDDDE